jgi:hypothetical protein
LILIILLAIEIVINNNCNMKTRFFISIMLILFVSISLSGQTNTGTLKIFSEEKITVFVDENPQANYQEIKLSVGTHYVRIMNGDAKVYGQIVTIVKDQVTSVLIETAKAAAPAQAVLPVVQKPAEANPVQSTGKTGTLNIFSELTGINVYLDENKQGDDIKQINAVPAGSHYLKVMKDGVSIFGELITINEGQTTTVLVKNDGQVAEKIMESKVKERQEYQNNKIDVLFSSNSLSRTSGSSTLFPGYYGYYGYSNSATTTTQIADFKIIKGGVEEISDRALASLVENRSVINAYDADYRSWSKAQSNGAIACLVGLVPAATIWVDIALKKPFLHKNPTGESMNFQAVPAWEWTTFVFSALVCYVGYKMMDTPQKNFIKPHYYRVDEASKDAQAHNKKLKEKLGLPESYDIDK